MGTNFDQLDQKECKVKGRGSIFIKETDPWVRKPLLAQDLCKSR